MQHNEEITTEPKQNIADVRNIILTLNYKTIKFLVFALMAQILLVPCIFLLSIS